MALFSSIWDDFRNALRSGRMVTRLAMVNFSVFLLVNVLYIALWLSLGTKDQVHITTLWNVLDYLCMPAYWKELLMHPWTPITSIFLHQGFFHLLSNMVWLYLFGTIIGDLIGDRRVLPLYLLGGLAGGLTYFISANVIPSVGAHALGASAAVMALGGASIILAPDYRVMLFLLGEVRVKYIVLFMVVLDLVGFANQDNTGGHAAHIGGFIMGVLFVYLLRDGKDLAEPVNRLLDRITGIFKPNQRRPQYRGKPQPSYKTSTRPNSTHGHSKSDDPSFQEKLDGILDKIKENGYDSLNAEEKEFLFQASKK